MNDQDLTGRVIGSAIEVHRVLGPGLLESAYEECLCYELSQNNIPFQRQQKLPVHYKNVQLDCGYIMDIVILERLVIELKTVERLAPIHEAQLLTLLGICSKSRPEWPLNPAYRTAQADCRCKVSSPLRHSNSISSFAIMITCVQSWD